MSTYTLGGSSYFLSDQTLGAVPTMMQTLQRAVTAPAAALPAPATRTATTPLVPLSPTLVGRAYREARMYPAPTPTTKVLPLPRTMIGPVRVAARAVVAPPGVVTRPVLVTPPRPIVKVPLYVQKLMADLAARRAGIPAGATGPVPVNPIEYATLAPAPAATAPLPASSPFSIVPTSPPAPIPDSSSTPVVPVTSAALTAPTPDASAEELKKIQGEVAPETPGAPAKVPNLGLWLVGGALALFWVVSKGMKPSSRGFGGGKASW